MRRTENAFKPKKWLSRFHHVTPSTTIAILCPGCVFVFLFGCVFFGGTLKFSIFGWANLHMTARMCSVRVCSGIWQTHGMAVGCRLVGSESERIQKDKRPDCTTRRLLTVAACKIAEIEIARRTKEKKKMINGLVASTGRLQFAFAYMQFAYVSDIVDLAKNKDGK